MKLARYRFSTPQCYCAPERNRTLIAWVQNRNNRPLYYRSIDLVGRRGIEPPRSEDLFYRQASPPPAQPTHCVHISISLLASVLLSLSLFQRYRTAADITHVYLNPLAITTLSLLLRFSMLVGNIYLCLFFFFLLFLQPSSTSLRIALGLLEALWYLLANLALALPFFWPFHTLEV